MKRLALYPFLLVLYFILTPLDYNLGQIDPALALRPLLVMMLAAGAGLLLFYRLSRDWQYASYLVFVLVLYFFAFGHLNRFIQNTLSIIGRTIPEELPLAVCTGLLMVLMFKNVWRFLGGGKWLTSYLNILIILWLLFPAYGFFSGLMNDPVNANLEPVENLSGTAELEIDCSFTPDIYYIILDAYGRADMLKELYNFDNRSFLNELRHKGFYIAEDSFTNYTQTIYAIPGGLNFQYIDPPGGGISGQIYFSDLIKNNAIMSLLESCGYQTVSLETGFFFTDHPEVDLYLENGIGDNEFESLLLADSPVDVLGDDLNLEPPEHSYEAHRQRVLYSFDQLATLFELPGPKFVFAHILSPHPPFVFDSSGNPIEPGYSYNIGDGNDFKGSQSDYRAGYPVQTQFVNQKITQAVDSILANSDLTPVIIIQGDHGPGSSLVWDSPKQTCLWERSAILNAYYLPEAAKSMLYPAISPVNSFRIVLNTIFGTDLPLLPDQTFFTFHILDRQAIDITQQRTSRANCTIP